MNKADFNFYLPDDLIAQYPLAERKASRMLCLNRSTGAICDRLFTDFVGLVNANDLLVFNNTKVIPARLFGFKSTGGKVEILIERVLDDDRALAHVKASKAPKNGSLLQLDMDYRGLVLGRQDDLFVLQFDTHHESIFSMLDKIGHVPLPPYITRADEKADEQRYQSIFAKYPGAVAAPTASLHFDADIVNQLYAKGLKTADVTLHVGSGTFQPVRVDDLSQHRMHFEYYSVSQETVTSVLQCKAQGGRIIAIGTTAVRALESASQQGSLTTSSGETNLFIMPGYRFITVDAMLTNFHLPESTLIMLVSAFAGYQPVMAAYQHAIQEKYRFFSYGDAMFLS
jgi:S-adenosylmethionine:tRNA ribosyltransferase-isomerase